MARALIISSLLFCTTAAAAPGTMVHQGRLLDSAGGAVDGVREIDFSIYTQATGGAAVWTERDTVALASGFYATVLGDSTPGLAALDWGRTHYWVGASIVGGDELLPRTEVGSVPSAMSLAGGFRPTPVTSAERDALSVAPGTLVYNTEVAQVQVWDGASWRALGAGTAAGTDAGRLVGWGYNGWGGLGLGDNTRRDYPSAVSYPPGDIVKMSMGGYNHGSIAATCAIDSAGRMYCTGYESHVPDGSSSNRNTFIQVGADKTWRDVAMGNGLVSCGITTSDDAYCWGYRIYGGLGDGVHAGDYIRTPVAVTGGLKWRHFVPVGRYNGSAHIATVCGVTTTTGAPNGYCWGNDSYGQAGNGAGGENYTTPALLPGIEWKAIYPGFLHVCGISVTDDAYCWGYNGSGQIGNGNTTNAQSPTLVSGGHKWSQLALANDSTCGVRTDGVAMCWGYNGYGHLGDGTTSNRLLPTEVVGGKRWKQITMGEIHACALDTSDRAFCWGYNGNGQLGDGTTTNRYAPVPVYGEYTFSQIDGGVRDTMALTR